MKLFDLLPEHRALLELVDEQTGGELTPDVEANLDAFFAEIGDAEAVKLDSYAGLIRTLESQAAAAQAEVDRFQMVKRAAENAAKRLKERVKVYLELQGRTKAVTAAGRTFAIQKNGGKQMLQIDLPPEELPKQFQKVVVQADEEALRVRLEVGEPLEFARLLPRGTHLRLK